VENDQNRSDFIPTEWQKANSLREFKFLNWEFLHSYKVFYCEKCKRAQESLGERKITLGKGKLSSSKNSAQQVIINGI